MNEKKTEESKQGEIETAGSFPLQSGVSHTLTYEDFIKWMTDKHPEVVLMPIQHKYARFRFSKNFKTGIYSWPFRAGKTTILKLIYQFTAECG